MAGVELQQFISSHRAQLNEEKLRFQERAPRSILPSDTKASEHASQLRRERESEYKEFLKTKASAPKSRSISEIRRDIAQDRDQELSSRSDSNLVSERGREFDYGHLKERKLAEERQYRNHDYNDRRPTWRDGRPSVSFKEDQDRPPPKDGSWESEEKDLVSWARRQHTSKRSNRPPSPVSHTSIRSISAPTPPTLGGIATLGGRDNDLEAKRNRQKEYAESLRAQMREKEQFMYKQPPGSTQKTPSQRSKSPEPSRVSPRRESYKESHRTRSPPVEHREPPMRDQHYPHYYHYPPPPPPPQHYYMPSYYHPPPPHRDSYYDRPDPYRYPYYPPQEYGTPGSYLPPHVPTHVPSRPYDDWREPKSSRRERASEARRSGEKVEDRSESRKDKVYTSPIHGDGTKASKMDKNSYRRELEQQMKEKKERDFKAKIEREKYEQKKENEIYDPFGKGGCGAPVRDQHGNLVADLKKMKRLNDERTGMSPRNSQEFAKIEDSPVRRSMDDESKVTPQQKTVLTYDKVDDDTHKKNDQESYRDYLRRQVQEKEERKRKQKEVEMLEERKEMERLEKDRLKLESDLKKEQRKERLTEVELKRKDEALKKEAEMERRELAIKQKEELHLKQVREKQLADQRMQELADKMAQPIQQHRSRSPPIPTLRKQQNQQGGGGTTQSPPQAQPLPPQPTSPPVPTLQKQKTTTQVQQPQPGQAQSPPVPTLQRKQTNSITLTQNQQQSTSQTEQRSVPRPVQQVNFQSEQIVAQPPPHQIPAPQLEQRSTSQTINQAVPQPVHGSVPPPIITTTGDQATESTILSQLAAMRMHLQSQLADQIKAGPSDTQLQQAPKQTNPVPRAAAGPRVRQPHSGAHVDKFASLKYKNPFPNQEFLNQFPNPPRSDSALEVQQGAMLRHQEERLARLRNRGKDKENKPSAVFGGLLSSDSHGVPLSSADPFHEGAGSKPDFLSVPRGRSNGRGTSAGGQSQISVSTLDVDRMVNRNEERMRRLDSILNAGTASHGVRSVGGGYEPGGGGGRRNIGEDSETILSNFLNRDSHSRPSVTRESEKSLECETAYQRLGTPNT